jgi:uncharacterized protein
MSNSIIIKTFRTYGHPYVYDRHTDALVMLNEDEYDELVRCEKGGLPVEQSPVIGRYQQYGMFMPNVVEKIENAGTEKIEHQLKTRMKQLTLQVTQQCNLRCGYCAYSGVYNNNRVHTNKRMSLETAQKAIKFFLDRNNGISDIVIGFYGGEPMLELDLIKQCVDYATSLVEGKRIRFNMTTNGTLLNDDAVDYLVKNDFTLGISLDGAKQEHDINRKFANGKGSFDTIIANIERIHRRYPEYSNHIMIMTTINPNMDLNCALEYFNTEELFRDKQIMFNSMTEISLKSKLSYDKNHYSIRNFEHIKMLFSLIGKLDRKYVSPLAISSRDKTERNQKSIRSRVKMSPIMHHNGPCMAGVQRLFVRVDGVLFPCERVNEELEYFKIGTLEDGLNLERIKELINIGKITEEECKECWNLRHCTICAGQIEFGTTSPKIAKLKICANSCRNTLGDMHELCVLNEFGFDVQEMRIV